MIPLNYNLRSLSERRRTTFATAFGIALVVFVISSSMMLSNGIHAAMGLSGHRDIAVVLRKGSDSEMGSTIAADQVGTILSAPGVAQMNGAPLGEGEIILVATLAREGSPDQVSNVQLRGMPEGYLKFRKDIKIVEGRAPTPGTDEAIIGKRLRGHFVGVDLNKEFEIKKNRSAKVVGVFEDNGSSHESEVWLDIDVLRSAFGREAMVSAVHVQLESPTRFDAFRDTVEQDKRLGLVAYQEDKFLEMQSEGTAIFITALGSVTAFFFSLGAIIGAMITMFAAVDQRKREVGVFRALGFSRWSILASFLMESTVLALISGVLGAVASLAMSTVQFSTMNFATWSEMVFRFTPTPSILLTSLGFALAMGVLGGFFPAYAASRVSPVEAMRN